MFDFDVVTGPNDLAKRERGEARRPPVPRHPPVREELPSASAGSGVVADEAGGYSGDGPA
jgi:hypothetical protein